MDNPLSRFSSSVCGGLDNPLLLVSPPSPPIHANATNLGEDYPPHTHAMLTLLTREGIIHRAPPRVPRWTTCG